RPPTTPPYTLSLHDALPISRCRVGVLRSCENVRGFGRLITRTRLGQRDRHSLVLLGHLGHSEAGIRAPEGLVHVAEFGEAERSADRKSTRLNSSHVSISYAV